MKRIIRQITDREKILASHISNKGTLSGTYKGSSQFAMLKKANNWTSLMVKWLRRHASTAGGVGSIPGWEEPKAYMPHNMAKKNIKNSK